MDLDTKTIAIAGVAGAGAVYLASRRGAGQTPGSGGDDDGGSDGGNGGTEPDPNQPPSVSIDGYTVDPDNGVIDVSANASDPENGLATISWALERDGTVVDTATGPTATMAMDGSGNYVLTAEAADVKGLTATDRVSFSYEAPSGCVSDGDCPHGQICENGECVDDYLGGGGNGGDDGGSDGGSDDGSTNECISDFDCGHGKICENGECVDSYLADTSYFR